MTADPRTDEQIRSDIAAEREQLAQALGDLREGVRAKRRLAAAVGTTVVSAAVVTAMLKIAGRLRGN